MRLQPNIGSDRSWVWKVHADYSEGDPTPETLAIRFANAESERYHADWFCSAVPDAPYNQTPLNSRSSLRMLSGSMPVL